MCVENIPKLHSEFLFRVLKKKKICAHFISHCTIYCTLSIEKHKNFRCHKRIFHDEIIFCTGNEKKFPSKWLHGNDVTILKLIKIREVGGSYCKDICGTRIAAHWLLLLWYFRNHFIFTEKKLQCCCFFTGSFYHMIWFQIQTHTNTPPPKNLNKLQKEFKIEFFWILVVYYTYMYKYSQEKYGWVSLLDLKVHEKLTYIFWS